MIKFLLSRLLPGVIVLLLIGLIGFLSLPFIIDRYILPPLLEKTLFSEHRANVTRITPFQINGSLEFRGDDKPAVSVPRFELLFTPRSLLNKQADTLILDHTTIHLFKENNRWVVPGLFNRQPAKQKSTSPNNLLILPFAVNTLVLKQCSIILHDEKSNELHFGLTGQLLPVFTETNEDRRLKSLSGSFVFFNDLAATVGFSASFNEDRHQLSANITNARLSLPENLTPSLLRPVQSEALSAELNLSVDANSLLPVEYDVSGSLEHMRFHQGNIGIVGTGSDDRVEFSLSGSAETFTYHVKSVGLRSPLAADLVVSGNGSYNNQAIATHGEIKAFILTGEPSNQIRLPLLLVYDGHRSESGDFLLELSGDYQSNQPVSVLQDSVLMGLDHLEFSSQIRADSDKIQADVKITSAPLELRFDKFRITTSDLNMSSHINRSDDQTSLRVKGVLNSLDIPDNKLFLRDIHFDLPIDLLPAENNPPQHGMLSFGSVGMKDTELFSVYTSLVQNGLNYTGDGTIKALFAPDLQILFNGTASAATKTAELAWTMPKVAITRESLPDLVAIPADLSFDALVETQGELRFKKGALTATLQSVLTDGFLEYPEKNISISGIKCAINLERLPEISSEPSQRCTADTIDLAALHFSDAAVSFRLEDPQTIFIEKSKMTWCGGSLESGSLRLSKNDPDIETTLYCSRINLGDLLNQFGFKGTEGEGSLNGKLPIKYTKGRIELDDGFLFSTPGTGGIVRFTDTELLRQGMGAVSEAGYINYSLQALEDFTYNWTTLSFTSSGDELLMALELDGKPSTALPFKFNTKGMIVETNEGDGLQYPIRLDVNFRLPLAELFQLGQSIQSIMGKN